MRQKKCFLYFLRYLGIRNYQIRYLGIFNQIWQKIMTAVSRFVSDGPVKKCPKNFTKSVFYAFYGILGIRNYQIRYLGIFNQIWQKIMNAISRFVSDGPRKEMSRKLSNC